jgi:integrase
MKRHRVTKSVWIEGKKRGPWWLRWRDGERTTSGALRKYRSGPYHDLIERNQAEAEKIRELAAAAMTERQRGVGIVTIANAIQAYTTMHLAIGRIAAPYAAELTATITRVANDRGWKTLRDITAASVETWRKEVVGKGTDKPLAALKRLLRWASHAPLNARIDDHVLHLQPRRRIPRPQPELLTSDQVAAILDRAAAFGPSIHTAIEHLSRYGCRPNELCRLTVGDWNPDRRELTHRRTKNRHPITHAVDAAYAARLTALTKGRRPTEPLFLSPDGDGWRANKAGKYTELVDWYWTNVAGQVPGLLPNQRGIYCLKDYAIQSMEDRGIDDRTKSTFTAITSLQVYARYKATNPTRNRAAAEAIAKPRGARTSTTKGH